MSIYKQLKKTIIGLILIMIICPYTISKAQSASITISADNNMITSGEEVMVSIQLTSKVILGDFEAYLSYNPEVLEFVNEASFIAGGEGLLKLSDINVINQEYTRKYVMKFKAKDIGYSDIGIKDSAVIYDYDSGKEMSVSSNRINIQVTADKAASNNNKLQSLKISPGILTPEFNKDITEYKVEVVSDVKQLIISSITEDDLATVTISGNDVLEPGENEVSVTVKAQSGDLKVYKLYVTKESLSTINNDDEIKENQGKDESDEYSNMEDDSFILNHMVIMKENNATYIQNGYRYEILELADETTIPEGYIKTSKTLNGITIIAYTLLNDIESEFFLIYAKNKNGVEGFYQFDRVENTLQRYTKNQKVNIINNENGLDITKESDDNKIILTLVFAVIILIIVNIMLFYIFIHNKVSKKKSRYYKVDNNIHDINKNG